jgi:hypothetical protein
VTERIKTGIIPVLPCISSFKLIAVVAVCLSFK